MEETEEGNVKKDEPKETHNKPSEEASWWGSWGQGWIDTVKEKSAVTLEMVKKDLNEFVDVIQGDTSTAISETATKLEENVDDTKSTHDATTKVVKKGMEGLSKLLHSVSELMAIDPDDSKDEFITLTDDRFSLQTYNRKQEKLHIIQTDPGTYCNEPEGLFREWLEVFNLDDHKTKMSELLVQNPAVRAIYTQLVPTAVSHTVFWQRYFYRVFQLDAEERKREELLARANKETTKEDDTDGGWGDDDDDDDIEVLASPFVPASAQAENTPDKVEAISNEDPVNSIQEPLKDTDKESDNIEISIPLSEISDNVDKNKELITETQNVPMDEPLGNAIIRTDLPTSSTLESEINELSSKTRDTHLNSQPIKIDDVLAISFDTIRTDSELENKLNNTDPHSETKITAEKNDSPTHSRVKQEFSETSSVSSWISIDDDMKVKKVKGEQEVKPESNGGSEGKSSSSSSAVIVNKSEADDIDEDFDLELDDDDVNEEELAKMVEDIKNKSAAGTLQDEDDDDWENWE